MDSIQIPDKTYFKIGEVAKLLDLQPYVLRYWETEFDSLGPEKTRSGQRAYRREDIDLLLLIKTLLYDEMYTIAGARRQLKLRKKGALSAVDPETAQRLVIERDELLETNTRLSDDVGRLERASEKLRHEASRLQLQNETLEDENAQLAAAQLEYESSIRRLRDELDQHRQTVRMLEDSRESLNQKLEEQSDQLEEFGESAVSSEELDAARNERNRAMDRVAELEREIATYVTSIDELETALQAAQATVAERETESREVASQVEQLEGRLSALSETVAKLEAEKAELSAAVSDTAELDSLRSELEALRNEHSRYVEGARANRQRSTQTFGLVRQELESLAALVN